MPSGAGRRSFVLRYLLNVARTWLLFHIRYPWVKYDGFVRVMSHTRFAKRNITLGNNVQFGKSCSVASDLTVGNDVLFAGRISFVGGNDHVFSVPGRTIWHSPRGQERGITVKDDVWVGTGCILMGGITIGTGSVIAAGAVVTKDVPPCEIWGGVPARKIKDRFATVEDKDKHLGYIASLSKGRESKK